MFGTDPEQIQQRVSQWAQQFEDRAQRFETMRQQVEQINVTEFVADGAVRVTVDSTGSPTDLVLSDKIRGMAPADLAAKIMTCLQRAQGRLAERVQEAMTATVGDDEQVVAHVVAGYRTRFPQQLQEDVPSTSAVMELGTIEDDDPPPRSTPPQRPTPSPSRRPQPPGGDADDFGGQSYLR
jgi:DNA-binding protein YbaB